MLDSMKLPTLPRYAVARVSKKLGQDFTGSNLDVSYAQVYNVTVLFKYMHYPRLNVMI